MGKGKKLNNFSVRWARWHISKKSPKNQVLVRTKILFIECIIQCNPSYYQLQLINGHNCRSQLDVLLSANCCCHAPKAALALNSGSLEPVILQ